MGIPKCKASTWDHHLWTPKFHQISQDIPLEYPGATEASTSPHEQPRFATRDGTDAAGGECARGLRLRFFLGLNQQTSGFNLI